MPEPIAIALVGVLGVVLGGAVGAFATLKSVEMKHESDVRKARLEFRLEQLNEFYAPIYLFRRRSQGYRMRLPDYDPLIPGQRWRLVHNIERAKENPEWCQAVEGIIRMGDAISERIISSAGLIAQSPPPQSFHLFLQHHDRLKESWLVGKSQPKPESWEFPGGVASRSDFQGCAEGDVAKNVNEDLDCAIWEGMQYVCRDAAELLKVDDGVSSLFDPILLPSMLKQDPPE